MRVTTVTVALVVVFAAFVSAQPTATDEQIRALIAKLDSTEVVQGISTNDRIFWSGAYKRPFIGAQPGEQTPGDGAISNRVPGSQRAKTTPVRIEGGEVG